MSEGQEDYAEGEDYYEEGGEEDYDGVEGEGEEVNRYRMHQIHPSNF